MPVSVTMPRLGESVTEGTVTRWLKHEGDRVEVDEPLLEVSTDKVDTEIPSPAAGVLSRIVVGEDETAEVGSELAVIAGEDETAGTGDAAPAAQAASGAAAGGASGDTAGQKAPAAPAPRGDSTGEGAPPSAAEVAGAAESSPPAASEPAAANAAPAAANAAPVAEPASSRAAAGGDATPIKMPALGESVTEGTVTRWLKQVGDSVEVDEPLLEVSTDKVDTEIPSPVAGVVLEIKVAEDDVAAVGADLAVVGAAGAPPAPQAPAEPPPSRPAPAQPAPAAEAPAQPAPAAEAPAEQAPAAAPAPSPAPSPAAAPASPAPAGAGPAGAGVATTEGGDGYVTPLVRKLAAEHGVDLARINGTGVGGRIRKQDVLAAAEQAKAAAAKAAETPSAPTPSAPAAPAPAAAQPSPLRGRTEKLSRLRALIAKRMVESLHVAAQLTTVVEVDVTRIAKLRDQAKAEFQARHGVKLSFLPFFALATVEALRVHPVMNASIDMDAGTVTYHDAEHLGIAVDTERGLVVPVIRDAGDLNLAGLAKRIADLADRTRTNKISPDELSGGTFTVTNTGSRGALFDTPIINQPQVGILGTGAVVRRAAVVDEPEFGEIVATRSMVYLALSYDHRLVDGAEAARFLTTIKERLEAGAFETELGL